MKITVKVDGEPVPQSRPRVRRMGGVYYPKHVIAYRKLVTEEAKKVMEGREPLTGAVKVEIDIFRPIPKSMSKKRTSEADRGILRPTTKADLDNYGKAVTDSCNGIVYVDDSQICELNMRKWYSVHPRMELTAEEI